MKLSERTTSIIFYAVVFFLLVSMLLTFIRNSMDMYKAQMEGRNYVDNTLFIHIALTNDVSIYPEETTP
jgi:hypothetical protein